MEESAVKGNCAELASMHYLQSLGCGISIPFGSLRYDFIIDYKNKLYRIQCKSGKLKNNDEYLYVQLTSGNNKRVKFYDDSEIDFFCTAIAGKRYLLPKEEIKTRTFTLRLVEPKNKQELGIHMAQDYLADKILSSLK